MPVTSVVKDPNALTMTVTAEFAVPLRRLWDAYADPRKIERFWGPPTWPATFTRHDMAVGGRSIYTMRGPDGSSSSGYWEFLAVEAPHRFEVRDGFLNADESPNTDLPSMRMVFAFAETKTGSRLVTTTYFRRHRRSPSSSRWAWNRGCAKPWAKSTACSRTSLRSRPGVAPRRNFFPTRRYA